MGETPDKVVLVGNLKFPTWDSPAFTRVRMSTGDMFSKIRGLLMTRRCGQLGGYEEVLAVGAESHEAFGFVEACPV
jgi:hypothetical protein